LTEDIITELARFRDLYVVAPNLTIEYKSQSVDAGAAGRKLGVKYVLEGTVRKAGDTVRVTVQLIQADTGAHIWANRYDRDIHDIFSVQEEIAGRIAATITGSGGVLFAAERAASERKRPEQLEAYEYVLRASMTSDRWSRAGYVQSKRDLQKAIELDPTFVVRIATMRP
jgi:adenylate cyclase